MKKNLIWLPFLIGALVIAVYAFRWRLNSFIPNAYIVSLFLFPILLLVFRRISFSDLGIKIGRPLYGVFFVLLLPAILFLRYYLAGGSFNVPEGISVILIGSVAEEFFFRGYLQEELRKSFGSNVGIGIASLFFMAVHIVKGYSIPSSLMILVIGIYFGVARDKRGADSTVYSMGAHSLYNLIVASVKIP